MTHAPRSPRLAFDDMADVAAALREGGGRLSGPRRVVLEALFAAEGPVSAEYIARGGDEGAPRPDPSSVYRALEHLEGLGVVRHVHLGHGPGLYALTGTGEQEYLVCERCDRVTSVASARLDAVRTAIRENFGYRARFSHFPIVGLCASCADSEEPGQGEAHPPFDHSHDPTDHEHQHSHGDRVHSHPHVHQKGLEKDHEHAH